MSDIKPCPFCGSSRTSVGPFHDNRKIKAVFCGHCSSSGPISTKTKEAVAKWNSRVEQRVPDSVALLEFIPFLDWPNE